MGAPDIPIALVGIGKIARDQHIPAIADHPRFRLAATVSGSGGIEGVENYETIDALLAQCPDIKVVSLCMPPVPRFAAARAAIAAGRHVMLEKPPGATVAEVLRHGKQLGITSREGPAVGVHLGMTGQVLYRGPGERLPARDHVHVTWRFAGGGRMVFRDPRRFGGVTAHPNEADLRSARFGRLGPDGLTVTAGQLSAALGRSARAIKAALLDQTAVAGVGNIYADESLHRARLSPLRPAQSLAPADFDRLASEVRTVLAEAVEARGSTLRDYTDSDGNPGAAQLAHRVYGRARQGCMACGSRLSHAIVGQRMTVWCERCQG